jgi:hypothetical protein
LDYDTETAKIASSGVSRKGNARFAGYGNPFGIDKRIAELPDRSVPLPINDHTLIRLSALPVAESDVIVLGKVTDAIAHLSNDGTGIYSEFPVEVSEVFKDSIKGSVNVGTAISTTRAGGAVRFASGKVQEYRTYGQGMPVGGGQYVLFLKRNEAGGDFTILTGYELANGLVTPIDGEDNNDPKATLSFAYYRNVAEGQLIQDLRLAIQRGGDK